MYRFSPHKYRFAQQCVGHYSNTVPLNRFEPQISEKLVMDWNDLMYNIGGTVGMWIGVSIFNIINLVISLINLCNFLRHTIKLWFVPYVQIKLGLRV